MAFALRAFATAVVAAGLLAGPASAATEPPFSFGIDTGARGDAQVAYAAGPGGDRMIVTYGDSTDGLVARRIRRGAQRPDEPRVVARREGYRTVDFHSLAYNAREREYLLVFYWWSSDGSGATELLAQRIAPDGTARGELRTVSHGAARGDVQPVAPEVLYEPRSGGYLVVWSADNTAGSTRRAIYSQLLDSSGHPTSHTDTALGTQRTFNRQVVRDATSGTFLLAHMGAASPDGPPLLVTRRLDSAGRPIAAERSVRLPTATSTFRVAYGSRARRYVVAVDRSRAPQRIELRTLDRAGRRLGAGAGVIRAPSTAPGTSLRSLVYASRSDRFLLTWSFVDDQFRLGTFMYPRGQRIRGDGRRLAGSRLAFGARGKNQPVSFLGPLATYDARDDEHLVIWNEREGDAGAELWGRRVSAR